MRYFVMVLILIASATAAFAGPIIDVQTGVYAEGDQVVVPSAVVTGARDNGFFMSENPNAPYAGVWVYTGTGNHTAVAGDLVEVAGIYKEYYDLTEIDVAADSLGYANVIGVSAGDLLPLEVTAAMLAADAEPYEGCLITVTDGLMVTEAANNYGEWTAESMDEPGNFVVFDDYFFDPANLMVGDCMDGATGCLYYSFGAFKLQALADGVVLGDCTVDTEDLSLDAVKSLYR